MKNLKHSHTEILGLFWSAPDRALFDQNVIAVVTARSIHTLQRARWAGKGGPKFIKIGHSVRYQKSDVLEFLESFQSILSTKSHKN